MSTLRLKNRGERSPYRYLAPANTGVYSGADLDRNGRRNHDELRFWSDYTAGPEQSQYIYEDHKQHGGLPHSAIRNPNSASP